MRSFPLKHYLYKCHIPVKLRLYLAKRSSVCTDLYTGDWSLSLTSLFCLFHRTIIYFQLFTGELIIFKGHDTQTHILINITQGKNTVISISFCPQISKEFPFNFTPPLHLHYCCFSLKALTGFSISWHVKFCDSMEVAITPETYPIQNWVITDILSHKLRLFN